MKRETAKCEPAVVQQFESQMEKPGKTKQTIPTKRFCTLVRCLSEQILWDLSSATNG